MDFRTIRYEQLGSVVRITANRPEVLNAQSRVMIRRSAPTGRRRGPGA